MPLVNLNDIVLIVLLGFLIIVLISIMASGELNVVTLIFCVVIIMIVYAVIPEIQEIITSLAGG